MRTISVALTLALPLVFSTRCSAQSYDEARRQMVRDQLEARDITDPLVLHAMAVVPRERFVPGLVRVEAYADHALPIGNSQTISQPYIVALMTQLAELEPDDVVLEIGTGSGYQAAVLATIVDKVFTVEIIPELAAPARERFVALGYANIETRVGDGFVGWEERGPFDAILVTAAPDEVPVPLIEQLAPGGVLVIPVGPQSQVQNLRRIRKNTDGSTTSENVLPVRFVPLVRNNN